MAVEDVFYILFQVSSISLPSRIIS